jgi:HK97 gp10 family phage protein
MAKRVGSFKAQASLVEIDLARFGSEIAEAVRIGVERTAYEAWASAVQRAPVRKVFKGGRQTTRAQTHQEHFSALLAMGASQSETIRRLATTRPPRAVTARNRANAYNTTARARLVDTLSERRLLNPYYERYLTSRGRYELRSGRALSRDTFSQGSLREAGEPSERLMLGGSLRRSIRTDDRSRGPKIKSSVIAGGGRVDYARYVEFGTRHAAAQPFLRPALKHVEKKFRANILNSLRRVGTPGGPS